MRILLFSLLLCLCAFPSPLIAADESAAFRSTGYPIPRFVSLRSNEVFVRTGPGRKYPVQWVFKKAGLPVEIILEYDIWRKIKDFEGQVGWVHKSLLVGKRTALVAGNDVVSIYKKPNKQSPVMAKLEPKVLVDLGECTLDWCRVNASGYKGWLEKTALWGVYEREKFD